MTAVSFVLNIGLFGVGSPLALDPPPTVGGYGFLDFDLISLHETTADPNLAELGYFAVLYFRIAKI